MSSNFAIAKTYSFADSILQHRLCSASHTLTHHQKNSRSSSLKNTLDTETILLKLSKHSTVI
jgi:hypothetical protein